MNCLRVMATSRGWQTERPCEVSGIGNGFVLSLFYFTVNGLFIIFLAAADVVATGLLFQAYHTSDGDSARGAVVA